MTFAKRSSSCARRCKTANDCLSKRGDFSPAQNGSFASGNDVRRGSARSKKPSHLRSSRSFGLRKPGALSTSAPQQRVRKQDHKNDQGRQTKACHDEGALTHCPKMCRPTLRSATLLNQVYQCQEGNAVRLSE